MTRRSPRRNLLDIANKYLAWLMAQHDWSLQEAYTYSLHGEAERQLLKQRGRPDPQHCALCQRYFDLHKASPHVSTARTPRERATAIRADQPDNVRRWSRVDQPCPKPGCQYPVNHSGPHKISHDLGEMLDNSIAALDAREADAS